MSTSEILVTPAFARTMAAYNAEMNRRLYAAASRLPVEERARDRGAFWKSIHGTRALTLLGDTPSRSRLDGWERPAVGIKESPSGHADFAALTAARVTADAKIADWAGRLTPEWLADDLVWFSGAAGREIRMAKSLLVTHFF